MVNKPSLEVILKFVINNEKYIIKKRDIDPTIEKERARLPIIKYMNFAKKQNTGYPGKWGCKFDKSNSS